MAIDKEYLAKMILIFTVVVLVLLFVGPNIWKIAKGVLAIDDKKIEGIDVDKSRSDIFSLFKSDVASCLNNKDNECYCALANSFIPGGAVLEFKNVGGNLHLSFYRDIEFSSCSIPITSNPVSENVSIGNVFFVENSYGKPDLDNGESGVYSVKSDDYVQGDKAYLVGGELCSSKEVAGRNFIDFSSGILYKTYGGILLTRKQDNLRLCGINYS